ncbi:heparinase II/III domain-containing protein [Alcaligenes sp. Marseille-Q7550]
METHADVLANEEFYAKVGNHALHQNFALLSASIVLNRGDYLDLSLVRLEKLRAISIDDEGVSLEGSVGYHLFNIDWWLSMSAQLKVIDGLIENSISIDIPDMRPFLQYSIAPDGKIVPLGDSILSRGPYRNVINEYHVDFIKYIESDPNLLYVISCGQSGDPLPETMRVFSDGFWFSRGNRFDVSPRLHSHASLKFGPGLADRVHVHDDAGSITFYPNGVRLIDDSCLYGYYGGDKREFVKSNRAHNVIVVEDRKYYRSAVSVLDFSNSSSDFDQAEVNILSVEKTRWTRIVFHAYNNGLLYVQDHVVTNGAPFQQIFNLGDDFRVVRILPGRVEVQNSKGVRAIILWLEKNTSVGYYFGSESPLMGWRSTYEGEIHPISCVSANFSEVGEGEVKKIGAVILMLEPDDEFSGVYIESVELRKKTSKFVIKKSSKKMEIVVVFGGESFRSKILVD